MSFTEDGKHFPDEVLVEEAKRNSELLQIFFNEHKDFKTENFEAWERILRRHTGPFRDILAQVQGVEGWKLTSSAIFNDGVVEGIFDTPYIVEPALQRQVRAVGVGVMNIGYEISYNPTLAALILPIRDRIAELDFINPFLADRDGIERYVRRTADKGAEVRVRFPHVTSRVPLISASDFWSNAFGEDFELLYERKELK